MAEIIKVFKEKVPAMRFIGKKHPDYANWGEWFGNGWFDIVEGAMDGVGNIKEIWVNGGGYVGIELRGEGKPFEYWIGMFTPAGTKVPEGFSHMDLDAGNLGVCWRYGKEFDYRDPAGCKRALEENGMEIADIDSATLSFENGLCPRFTTPDEKGNVILDYCFYVI